MILGSVTVIPAFAGMTALLNYCVDNNACWKPKAFTSVKRGVAGGNVAQ